MTPLSHLLASDDVQIVREELSQPFQIPNFIFELRKNLLFKDYLSVCSLKQFFGITVLFLSAMERKIEKNKETSVATMK
jgi:hypothetical protein